MNEWIALTFPINPDGTYKVFSDIGATIFDLSNIDIFSSITTTPPTYAELSALPCASEGWQKVFDQWKANGLVK
jgi:hypothetical protein